MAKSHPHRSHHVQSEKPAPPPPASEGTVPSSSSGEGEERSRVSNLQIALGVWLIGFIALVVWMVLDLVLGLFR